MRGLLGGLVSGSKFMALLYPFLEIVKIIFSLRCSGAPLILTKLKYSNSVRHNYKCLLSIGLTRCCTELQYVAYNQSFKFFSI